MGRVLHKNHPTGTHCIFNPKTKRIIVTGDVTFLDKSYGEYHKIQQPVILTTSYERSDDEEELEIVSKNNNNNSDVNIVSNSNRDSSDDDLENNEEIFLDKDDNEQVISLPTTPVNSKLIHTMKKLQAS